MDKFNQLISTGARDGVSDFHITGGHPVVWRKNGRIGFDSNWVWAHTEVDDLVRRILNPEQMAALKARLSVDLARSVSHIRIRVNVFNTTRGLSLAIRLLPGKVPDIDSLNLHPSLKDFCKLTSGLILICGATGCGKSTTIAAMTEQINRTRAAHIITLEDPVEFRFLSRQSFVEQRELGAHIPSFYQGLLDVLREDPDVIVVGEIRDPETIKLTLNAAEAGHLVIASLHAAHSEDALHRICNSSPPETQHVIRNQLGSTLALIVIQRLMFVPRLGFRVPLLSILRGTQAVKGIIRDDRFSQIESAIQTGRRDGMFSAEKYKTEYLDVRTSFINPTENFKPSEEATPEIIYRSKVMGSPSPGAQPKSASLQIEAASEPDRNAKRPASGDQYVINEDASIEEVIAQISNA